MPTPPLHPTPRQKKKKKKKKNKKLKINKIKKKLIIFKKILYLLNTTYKYKVINTPSIKKKSLPKQVKLRRQRCNIKEKKFPPQSRRLAIS